MVIEGNGSTWADSPELPLDSLFEVLAKYPLDPRTSVKRQFVRPIGDGTFLAQGNFIEVSHGFCIAGSLEEMLPLARAIRRNRRTPAYRSFCSRRENSLYVEMSRRRIERSLFDGVTA